MHRALGGARSCTLLVADLAVALPRTDSSDVTIDYRLLFGALAALAGALMAFRAYQRHRGGVRWLFLVGAILIGIAAVGSLAIAFRRVVADDPRAHQPARIANETSETNSETRSADTCEAPRAAGLRLESIGRFESPVFVTHAGVANEVYVVERAGTIRVVRGAQVDSPPFFDIRERVVDGNMEQGLLGLAFHPRYAQNGRFFVYYTAPANVVAEYNRTAPQTEVKRLLELPDREGNHNGGMIAFGPDGFLYVGTGDEGGGCDDHGPVGNSQNLQSLFGKILRLDVDGDPSSGFAARGNPFAPPAAKPAIWAFGLRNPWRFSFDRENGDLYIGDVGQLVEEEIDFHPRARAAGENYGWRAFEGEHSATQSRCPETALSRGHHRAPIFSFRHGMGGDAPIRGGCSVTGGYVYRGDAISGLRGAYLFGDYCSPDIGAFRVCGAMRSPVTRLASFSEISQGLASFGEDAEGNIHVANVASGYVYRLSHEMTH